MSRKTKREIRHDGLFWHTQNFRGRDAGPLQWDTTTNNLLIYLLLEIRMINIITIKLCQNYRDFAVQEKSLANYSAQEGDTSKSTKLTRAQSASAQETIPAPGTTLSQGSCLESRTRPKTSARTTDTACLNHHQKHTGSSATKTDLLTKSCKLIRYQLKCDEAGYVLKIVH